MSTSLLTRETRKQIPILLVLLACGSLTTMTGSVVAPVMPEVKDQLLIDPRWSGMLVSMHCLTIFLFSPIFGILADRIGKAKVLIPSLICYAIFGTAGAFANGFTPLLISRALLGAASGGIAAASIGILSSMYEGEKRTRILGYTTSALAIASIIFPIVGGLLGKYNWRFTFAMYSLAIPAALLAYYLLPKRKRKGSSSISLGQKDKLIASLKASSTITLFTALALTSAIFYVVIIYAPLHFKEAIGADTATNGAILASRAIGAAVISAVGASKLAKRLGSAKAIGLGFVLMALTLMTIPFVEQLYFILPTAIIFGMGFGIVMPNLYDALSKSTPKEVRSSILAIGTGASNLGQFFSPIFLGPVWKNADIGVFFVGAGVALITALLSIQQGKALEKARYDN
ncbi:major facilitator superfamily MFS_1 [Calothrix parasitica NIES-267]|uniref:Major facilitator superfamily MFS_1 n=1 Tax=Calothrix parasitica NIES-267 TaxID=1973488 RepID=A0A1Z4LIH3_9CYAN|nr:major facilitator superfamily MFS_1 [Calothrix parasitica NIES-267]